MATDQQGNGQTDTAAERPWHPWWCIIAASALAHLWCLGSQFYMDDMPQILDNANVHAGKFWQTWPVAWTYLGYVVQYKVFGMSSVAFHAVNWLLHTAVGCVLFGFGRDFLRGRVPVGNACHVQAAAAESEPRQAGRPSGNTVGTAGFRSAPAGVALLGALLFAVHPLASEIPNYARTQDIAWVTLFSLLAAWALLRFLRDGAWPKLLWTALAITGATLSKGPGLFHALMMAGAVGLAFMTAGHWHAIRRHGWWVAGGFLLGTVALWASGLLPNLLDATRLWAEPRFIGHAYTLARVFWEFAWRSVLPVALCSDHHIAETLVPPGAGWLGIPDTGAMWAAAAMLALTVFSLCLCWRKSTRLFGVCLFLYVATILFRVAYLIPEFMPEYRIYPGLPWFCLGAAIMLGAVWRCVSASVSPRLPAVLLVLVFAIMSARRSLLWHDLDSLTADILRRYPAQARAVWELQDRDAVAGRWQQVIDRQRTVWPLVFNRFMAENRRLAPMRELPSGHFALADVACAGRYAQAIAHVAGPSAGMAEIRRLEIYMRHNNLDPEAHRIHWDYFFIAKVRVLEQAGNDQATLDFMRRVGLEHFSESEILSIESRLKPGS